MQRPARRRPEGSFEDGKDTEQADPGGDGGRHGQPVRRPDLDYSLYDARRAGFETVVFIIKPEIDEAFRQSVGARAEAAGLTVRYAYQTLDRLPAGFAVPEGRQKPWGTAHAVLAAADQIDAPFAVINADDYYGPTGFRLIHDHLAAACAGPDAPAPWAMVGFLLGNTVSANGSVSRGVCQLDEHSRLVQVTERTRIEKRGDGIAYTEDGGASWVPLPADAVVSMNLWGFTPDFVDRARAGFAAFLTENLPKNPLKCEYYLPSVVTAALEAGDAAVTVLTSPDRWHGITYREDKPELMEALARMSREGLYPQDRLF